MAIQDCQDRLGAKVLSADQFQPASVSLSVSFETENENDVLGGTAAQNDRLHTRSLAGRTDDGHIAIRRCAVALLCSE